MSTGVALVIACLAAAAHQIHAVDQKVLWTVTGSGSNALRDYVSDGVGNATQDSDLGGLYLPFYTIGTGAGQDNFVNSTYDYVVGDLPLPASKYNITGRPLVQFPLAIGAVTVYANITNFSGKQGLTLRLTPEVVAEIFQGNITTWDDPAILAINPNLTKLSPPLSAKQNITVVVRTDSVAGHQAFSTWLNGSSNGTWVLGVNQTIPWPKNLPNWIYTIGGSNITGLIANHTYSIGVTDAYAGKKAKLADAALLNKNGTYLQYSKADYNFTQLGNDTITFPNSPNLDWSKFNVVGLNGNKTWPIPTVAFAATNIDLRDKEDRGGAQKSMFGYLLGPTVAKQAAAYQEYPLPPAFLNQSLTALNLILTKSTLKFFENNQLPSLGAPYNLQYVSGAPNAPQAPPAQVAG